MSTVDAPRTGPTEAPVRTWPTETLARVPYWVYQDEANYRAELRRLFEGPTWNYVCLESDVAGPGQYRTTFVGEMPVIVARGEDGEIHAFENRCAHRGALIAIDDAGRTKRFQCVYHAWNYDLRGNLMSVAFERGSHGKGGMPADFCKADHGPRKLGIGHPVRARVRHPLERHPAHQGVSGRRDPRARRAGAAAAGRGAGALHPDAPEQLEALLREREGHLPREPAPRLLRHLPHHPSDPGRGRGGEPGGRHHASYTYRPGRGPHEHRLPRAGHPLGAAGYRLHDPSLLDTVDEFGDGISSRS